MLVKAKRILHHEHKYGKNCQTGKKADSWLQPDKGYGGTGDNSCFQKRYEEEGKGLMANGRDVRGRFNARGVSLLHINNLAVPGYEPIVSRFKSFEKYQQGHEEQQGSDIQFHRLP